MKYSFVLIAYNEQSTILSCIESILHQDALDNSFEIIVVDDGSRDATRELVGNFLATNSHVRLIGDGKNRGRGYGRYTGVNASFGEFIIMVDADIILPKDWLARTIPYMQNYDIAGGIAVPDGDVAYVYRRYKLHPKTVMGSTTITGNNGMYHRRVFEELSFNKHLREGEDVDFNNRALSLGITEYCIPGLTVEHQEHKSLQRSMLWLYQSGVGATRQLFHFHKVRLPDIAFAATFIAMVGAITALLVTGTALWFIVPILGVIGASFIHLRGKFYLSPRYFIRCLGAILTNTVLIIYYYIGRFVGIFIFAKQALANRSKPA